MAEKVVSSPGKVEDLYGLYMDLRRSDFSVKNVGADGGLTYVYLDPSEEKDPLSLIESWVGKPAPEMTSSIAKKRLKEIREVEEIEAERKSKREEEARLKEEARIEAEKIGLEPVIPTAGEIGMSESDVAPEDTSTSEEKVGFLKRLFHKLF